MALDFISENRRSEADVIILTDQEGKQYLSDVPGVRGRHNRLKIYGKIDCPSAARIIAKGKYVQHRVFFKVK